MARIIALLCYGERTKPMLADTRKPRLSLLRIVEMNLGFFGIQYSFGLQQSNMGPIYSYLGASEAVMPLLWLAGPMTGLLVQPIVGAMSDRTVSRLGRRTPYFLVGAVLCSLCLFAMPLSSALWMAASLLWVLDAANNITMEPYRAYVTDRLQPEQQPLGYLTQSAFTGLAQTLSYLSPAILVYLGIDKDMLSDNGIPLITRIAFVIGAILSITTILWSVFRVRELPLPAEEIARMKQQAHSVQATLAEVWDAIRAMPPAMRQLGLAMFCQWYAMFAYWQYVVLALARSLYGESNPASDGFRDAVLVNGWVGGFYNFVAFLAAFAMAPVVRRLGARRLHAACLAASGVAMVCISQITHAPLLLLPAIGVGLGWASMMGNPYIMLAQVIPAQRTGVYMGIFNMFIVIPMLIEALTMPLLYGPVLGSDPRHVLVFAGLTMLLGVGATLAVKLPDHRPLSGQTGSM